MSNLQQNTAIYSSTELYCIVQCCNILSTVKFLVYYTVLTIQYGKIQYSITDTLH